MNEILLIIVLIMLLGLMLSGQWIAFSLGAVAVYCFWSLGGKQAMYPVIFFGKIASFHFLAMPLFVWMGEILLASGAGKDIFDGLAPLFRRVRGGLLFVTIGANALFGAMSGSSIAAIGALGPTVVPELNRRGYKKEIALGTVATAGVLAVMIPPSMGLIAYGIVAEQSISMLFMAAIIPGILLALFLMATVFIWVKLRPEVVPPLEIEGGISRAYSYRDTIRLWPLAVLIVIVLGTIYTGIATATESAAIGVVGAILIACLKKKFSLSLLWNTLLKTVTFTGVMGLVVGGALGFSYVFAHAGLSSVLVEWLSKLPGPSWAKMIEIVGIYFVLGMFMDPPAMTMLTVPLFLPFVISLGYDPIWFGILQTMCCELGVITPPVGANLYVTQTITGEDFSLITKGTMPYWLTCIVFMVFLVLCPGVVMWIPSKM